MLTRWFREEEKATWWGLLSVSQNFGGAFTSFLASLLAKFFGWREALSIVGAMACVSSIFVFVFISDTPEQEGFPSIEQKRKADDAAPVNSQTPFWKDIVLNAALWILCAASFFQHLGRTAFLNWGTVYLMKAKHFSEVHASACFFFFEFGGALGTLAIGYISDKFFHRQRIPVIFLFFLLQLLASLLWIPFDNFFFNVLFISIFGFASFGLSTFIGLTGSEISTKRTAGE